MTREQAMGEDRFHRGQCVRHVGPRGGVRMTVEVWRRNGATKTWVTQPEWFHLPVKTGFRGPYAYIDQETAAEYHVPADCRPTVTGPGVTAHEQVPDAAEER